MQLCLPIPALSYMAVVCVSLYVHAVCTCAITILQVWLHGMAEQALGALKRMKAGLNAEKSRDKKKGKAWKEMSALYFSSTNKRKKLEHPQWKHKFMCLAYQTREGRVIRSRIRRQRGCNRLCGCGAGGIP